MINKESKQELISIGEAAKILGVHIDTLRRWDKEGTLKAIRIGKRGRRMYKKSEIILILKNEKTSKGS